MAAVNLRHIEILKNIDLCRVYAKMIWITGLRESANGRR